MKTSIAAIFAESIAAKERFLQDNIDTLEQVIDLIVCAFRAGRKLLLCGNGGSAADAQHIAAEFVNRYLIERPPLPALALTTDTSALTSITNDYGPEEVFAKQIQALGKAGDVLLAISTSGNSPNIIRALEVCRACGIHTIGLTGGAGGKVAALVDYLLCVSATSVTPRIQETHILVGHVICEMVDHKLFPTERRSL
jgi:D-sedoheptulose 7-phosphate isomerase